MTCINTRTLNLMVEYFKTKPAFLQYIQRMVPKSAPINREQFYPNAIIIKVRPCSKTEPHVFYAVSVFDLITVNEPATNLAEEVELPDSNPIPDVIEVKPCAQKYETSITYIASRQDLILLEDSDFVTMVRLSLDAKDYRKAYYLLSIADDYDFEFKSQSELGAYYETVLHCLVPCGNKYLFEIALKRADDACIITDLYELRDDRFPTNYRSSTVLHYMAKYGHTELLRSLIAIRPDLMPKLANARCEESNELIPIDCSSNSLSMTTPLQEALMNGHFEMACLLFKYTKSEHLSTILIDAIRAKNMRLVELLLGAEPRVMNEEIIATTLLSCGSLIGTRTKDGCLPIHTAARTGNQRIFELIYQATPSSLLLDQANTYRLTFFTYLVQYLETKTIGWLMKSNDFDPKLLTMTDSYSQRPLHWAACVGALGVCQLLYETYVKDDLLLKRTTFGNTALTLAVCWKQTEIVDYLTDPKLSNGLIGMDDGKGYTPLSLAIEHGNIEMCVILYERMDMLQLCDQANKYGHTVLHRVALLGTTDHIDLVLMDRVKSQPLLHLHDAKSQTALQLALTRSPEMYEHMLRAYQAFEQI